jgi:hypothetical protein
VDPDGNSELTVLSITVMAPNSRRADTIQIVVLWGKTVLQVFSLCPPRQFVLGEQNRRRKRSDFAIPASLLGARRVSLVTMRRAEPWLVVPELFGGCVQRADGSRAWLEPSHRDGRATAAEGERRFRLDRGTRAQLHAGPFTLLLRGTDRSPASRYAPSLEPSLLL